MYMKNIIYFYAPYTSSTVTKPPTESFTIIPRLAIVHYCLFNLDATYYGC